MTMSDMQIAEIVAGTGCINILVMLLIIVLCTVKNVLPDCRQECKYLMKL